LQNDYLFLINETWFSKVKTLVPARLKSFGRGINPEEQSESGSDVQLFDELQIFHSQRNSHCLLAGFF
jgi:hypothetical protein